MEKANNLENKNTHAWSDFPYRGQDKDKNWHYGGHCQVSETTYCTTEDYARNPVKVHHYIVEDAMTDWGMPNEPHLVEVKPETVCRPVGISDMEGNQLYENDILLHYSPDYGECEGIIRFGPYSGTSGGTHLGFYVEWNSKNEKVRDFRNDILFWAGQCRMIGNIFEQIPVKQ